MSEPAAADPDPDLHPDLEHDCVSSPSNRCTASSVAVDPKAGHKTITVPKALRQNQLLQVLEAHK